jgi:hypothetical protein
MKISTLGVLLFVVVIFGVMFIGFDKDVFLAVIMNVLLVALPIIFIMWLLSL